MRAFLLAIGLVACGHGSPPLPSPPPSPDVVPAVATSPLLSSVGPVPRGFARLSLAEALFHDQLVELETALGGELGKSPAECGISPTNLERIRVAVGEPLRIAAEIDGKIDRRAVACMAGEATLGALAQHGLVIRDRPGGLAIEYLVERGSTDGVRAVADELARRCAGDSCASIMAGPADRRLWAQLSFDKSFRLQLDGPSLGHGAATVAAVLDRLRKDLPVLGVLSVRDQGGALVMEVARDVSPASMTSVALIVRGQLLEAFRIPSNSMFPSLHFGDHIYAVKGPLMGEPVPGDLLIYRQDNREWVKRYLAGPGQTIAETSAGITIDGKLLPTEVIDPAYRFQEPDELSGRSSERTGALVREHLGPRSYLTVHTGPPHQVGTWTVPAGHVFFLGDNRNNSNDSRYLGPTPTTAIAGRVLGTWLAMRDGLLDWDRMGIPID